MLVPMRNLRYILLLIAMIVAYPLIHAAETADQVLKRAAAGINGANGLSATFNIDYGTQKLSGTLKASGKMFVLLTSSTSTWYDGKNMWTYNAGNHETTLMTPTAEEVAEANPLSLVNSYSSLFIASFAKSQTKGSKTILLTPKSKRSGYKSVHVTIPDGSNFPSKLVVVPSSGKTVTIIISNVKSSQKLPVSSFVYPKSKYPKVEIIDLR